jgi:hypothetical protein
MKKIFTLLLLALSLSAFSTSVTFEVSMKGSGWTYDSIFVVGDMSNWEFVQMADQGDSLFSVTMNIPADDSIVFYYITIGWWASDYLDYREIVPAECDGSAELYGWDGDRAFIIPAEAVTYGFYWGTCTEIEHDGGTAISDRSNTADFEMYPNPAGNLLTVQLPGATNGASIDIIDIAGKVAKTIVSSDTRNVIDISDLSEGLYMVRVQDSSTTMVKKLIVQ